MKRLFVVTVAILALGLSPLAADGNDTYAKHDQRWKQQHAAVWKSHSRQWVEYDREWQAHRGDPRWRREHAELWHDWYQWHRDDGGESGLSVQLNLSF